MAQGLDVRALSSAKSPPMETKNGGESVKRARGMGSRRIFSPQFKIQVLDSYRNDVDCRGNQRATARKYNIHRRQIQKWLQCEASLRTSVEESGKNEISAADLTGSKSRKKIDPEEKAAAAVTLNESAAAMARLGDAGGSDEEKDVHGALTRRMYGVEESRLETRNLKRVAQRLYPSLHTIPSAPEVNTVGGPKYFRGDVACAFGLSPGSDETLDDNFNRVIRTAQEEPLNLKSKVRTETLPGEDSMASSVVEIPPDKLTVSVGDHCESGLTLASENDGGPKSSASNVVLKCPAQNYNMGDISEQETRSGDSEKDELLCSRSVNSAESSCLASVPVPKTSSSSSSSLSSMSSSPKSPESVVGFKRGLDVDESGLVDVDSSQLSYCSENSPGKGAKKPKMESEQTKSFNPKRKWIEESMQEMMEEAGDQPQDLPTALPIKQRVKMNLRSLPEERLQAEKSVKPGGLLKSNFTIEKLCSPDTREPEITDSYTRPNFCALNLSPSDAFSLPPPLLISNRLVSDMAHYSLKPESYNRESQLTMSSYGSSEYSLNLPLKEERLSDSEDADVDILSTTPIEKKSFDFSGYNFGKRRSFSVQFKLTVLDAFYNDKDCNKNQRATARKFNINRRQVQKWLSQESDLRSESSLKNGKYLGRQRVGGAESLREGDGCSKCPHHCLSKKEDLYTFDQTIEVNVKPCSDKECLSVAAAAQVAAGEGGAGFPGSGHAKTDGFGFYGRTLFPNELKTGGNLYHRYLYPENNNLVYHDSILEGDVQSRVFWKRDPILAVEPGDIARRYKDISLILFQEYSHLPFQRTTFLAYGVNRRRMDYRMNGNESLVIRKPPENRAHSKTCEIS